MADDQSREEGMLQLRWNSHLENLQHLFNSLLEEELFVDVTLACQGGILRAHRVVLSACSNYFRRVLHESSCKHPTVIMKDVHRSEMEAILRFMYRGEIEVAETQLDSLLSTARLLQVNGFSDQVLKDHAKNNEQKKVLNKKRKRNFSAESTPRCKSALSSGDVEKNETLEKVAADSPLDLSSEVSDKISRSPDSSEPSSTTPMSALMVGDVVKDIKKEEVGSETYPYTVLDEQTSGSLLVQAVCPFCFKDCKRTAELRAHIRGHTGEKPFRCDICNAPFARSAHLKRHRRVHTGEKPFECHRCQKTFSRQDKLKLHMDRHRLRDSGGKMVIGRPRKDTRPAQPNAQPQTEESNPPSSSPAAASTPTPTPSELGVGMGQFAFPGAPAARPGPPRSPMASLPPPSSPGLPLAFSEIGYLSLLSLSQRGLGVVSTSELPSPTMPHLLNPQTLQELQMLRKAATTRSKGHRGRGQSSSGATAATESATETLINLVQQAGEAPAQS